MPVQDGTTEQGDVALATAKTGTPQQPETLTREQAEKMVKDARSAVMADVGRYKA